MFDPAVNPFRDAIKAAVLEGIASGENEETYSHEEVWAAVDEALKESEIAPAD